MRKSIDHIQIQLSALITAVLLCASNPLLANNYQDELFLGFSSKGIQLELIPVSRMNNEQLFRSAEAEMDFSMSQHHKQINFNWLALDGRQIYSGMSALRKIVRIGIVKRFKQKRLASYQQNTAPERSPKQGIFTNLDNYKLLVSEDRILVGFQYKF